MTLFFPKTFALPSALQERILVDAERNSLLDLIDPTTPTERTNPCVICYEREGDHVMLPCGHGGYCSTCAHTLLRRHLSSRTCPMCRSQIDTVVKMPVETPIGTEGDVLEATVGMHVREVKVWESDEALIRAFEEDLLLSVGLR